MVSIDDLDDRGLQPGMSAEVTILADEIKELVLVIPIQAVLGNVAMNEKRVCFVVDANGVPREREIIVGKSNDKLVEVKSGLEDGEKVALNPRPLLPEKSDLKPGTPTTRRGSEFEGGGEGKKGGKKGTKKGGAVPVPDPAPQQPNPRIQRPEGGNQPNTPPADRKRPN
jgi:Cu(I)/Ag(I) efflux system membrane fusion protein